MKKWVQWIGMAMVIITVLVFVSAIDYVAYELYADQERVQTASE